MMQNTTSIRNSAELSGEEYMALIDQYASATLTGMLALSASQETFTQEDLHQVCDTSYVIARLMMDKRDALIQEIATNGR